MAELVATNLDVARLQALADQQGVEINRLVDIQNRPLTVNVETMSDYYQTLSPEMMKRLTRKISLRNMFLG